MKRKDLETIITLNGVSKTVEQWISDKGLDIKKVQWRKNATRPWRVCLMTDAEMRERIKENKKRICTMTSRHFEVRQ